MKHLDYVLNLMKFAFRANRLLYVSIAISLFSVVIELLAMASLFPLMQLASGGGAATGGIIAQGLAFLGFTATAGAFLWVFIILLAARIITQLAGQSLSMFLGRRVMAQLCSQAFGQILHNLDLRKANEKSIGFYIGLAGDESFRASVLLMSLIQFVSTAALALLYFAFIARYSPATAAVIVFFSLCSLTALYKATKIAHRLGVRQTEGSRKAGSVFLDALNNIKAVRAFSAERYVANIHRALIFDYANTLFLSDAIALSIRLVPVLLLLLIFGAVLSWSAQSLENVSLAFIVTMIAYLMRFFPTVGQGINLLMKIASDAKSGKDVTAILGMQTTTQTGFVRSSGLEHINKIDLQQVCFSYDEHRKREILKGLDLTLEQNKSYAIVGKSGIGKSTLIDLLLKFYLPTAGHLFLNDEPISEIPDSEIRKKIILVSQEAAIFDDSVVNNICLGMEAALPDIQAACKSACIHDVIEKMPEGYNSRLQYQGKNLSGGQRQRIAIARALIRNPDVLIFDESTSALDKATQEVVIDNILREYADKIVIFVTHDPQIVERVDEVVDLAKINFALGSHHG